MTVGRFFGIGKVVALRPGMLGRIFATRVFVVNEDNSVWEPTQALDWLGVTWNFVLGSLEIVERRIVKIINTIDRIIDADFQVSARELASFHRSDYLYRACSW